MALTVEQLKAKLARVKNVHPDSQELHDTLSNALDEMEKEENPDEAHAIRLKSMKISIETFVMLNKMRHEIGK